MAPAGSVLSSVTIIMTDNRVQESKPTSEKRKLQNRISSQNYRQRRRQRLQLLDQLVQVPLDGASPFLVPPEFGALENNRNNRPSRDGIELLAPTGHQTASVDTTFPICASPLQNLQATFPSTSGTPLVGIGSIEKSNLEPQYSMWNFPPALGMAPSPDDTGNPWSPNIELSTYPSHPALPTNFNYNPEHPDRIALAIAGLSITEKRQLVGLLNLEINSELQNSHSQALNSSPSTNHRESATPPTESQSSDIHTEVSRYERWLRRRIFNHPHLPDPQINTIRVHQSSFYAAILANSQSIFLVNKEVLKEDGLSPYSIGPHTGHKAEDVPFARARFDALVPPDLRPTDQQLIHPHHPYVDVIPFASFRHRMMSALAADPPLVDEDEMCRDMDAEAFICWGGMGRAHGNASSSGQQDGYVDMAAEVPWDMRSWEPQVWFLRKYWFLVGGWDDEMWRSARWWAGLRGEVIRFDTV